MSRFDIRFLNLFVIVCLSLFSYFWTVQVFHFKFDLLFIFTVISFRLLASYFILNDYTLSWRKATPRTYLLKCIVVLIPLVFYVPIYYGIFEIAFMVNEALTYLVFLTFFVFAYQFFKNRNRQQRNKSLVIYGAGEAGLRIEKEFYNSEYKLKYFVDDKKKLHGRSIDSVKIISKKQLKEKIKDDKYDLLVIAIPSASRKRIKEIYERLGKYFHEIKILPSLEEILHDGDFKQQLINISIEDLLARHPKDLDKEKIDEFIKEKILLITGAGGSIGSEISRQCKKFGASKLILLDHSEFNLYSIVDELNSDIVIPVMQTVRNHGFIENTFKKYRPNIVIHAAAYKHVPLVEENILESISNNIIGTKNCIDLSIKYGVEKFVLISTDKAVRPTNVMGSTKRICELYAQNVNSNDTEIVAVRFGNVLGSSGSVIPKFKSQIESGGPVTVTHPEINRYFMMIPEACELVLQAASLGRGGEIFILDMGEPIKIVDLAKKMIELSGQDDIEIQFTGLRPGEKLYEELLINDTDCSTEYESITVAKPTKYEIEKLNQDIEELLVCDDKISKLKEIVPEFNHNNGSN